MAHAILFSRFRVAIKSRTRPACFNVKKGVMPLRSSGIQNALGIIQFRTKHRDFARSFDSQANLVAADFQDRDDDFAADQDGFTFASGEYEHESPSPC